MLGEAITIGTGLLGLWWSWTGTSIASTAINTSNTNAKPSPTPAVLHSLGAATAATNALPEVCLILHIYMCCIISSVVSVLYVMHATAESDAAVSPLSSTRNCTNMRGWEH
jgi:hypothetical protein